VNNRHDIAQTKRRLVIPVMDKAGTSPARYCFAIHVIDTMAPCRKNWGRPQGIGLGGRGLFIMREQWPIDRGRWSGL